MIFFDVGGTLLAERADPAAEIAATLRRLGLNPAGTELGGALAALAHAYHAGIYAPASEEGEEGLWRALATACLDRLPGGARPERVQALAATLRGYPAWYAPMPGMRDLLAVLHAEGCRLGVISNWAPSLLRLLAHHGLGPFAVVACSGPLRTAKPDLGIFRWALAEAGIPASDAWYVGNEPAIDYEPAAAVGMRPILWDPAGRYASSGMRRADSATALRRLLAEDGAR